MDGSKNKPRHLPCLRLQHDEAIVEEAFTLGRTLERHDKPANKRCIVCDQTTPDSDVTVSEADVIPFRRRR